MTRVACRTYDIRIYSKSSEWQVIYDDRTIHCPSNQSWEWTSHELYRNWTSRELKHYKEWLLKKSLPRWRSSNWARRKAARSSSRRLPLQRRHSNDLLASLWCHQLSGTPARTIVLTLAACTMARLRCLFEADRADHCKINRWWLEKSSSPDLNYQGTWHALPRTSVYA